MKIYIMGTGILGKLIAEIIESQKNIEVGGFFDDGYPQKRKVFGYNVIGNLADIELQSAPNLAIGIGEPKFRKKIYIEKSEKGFNFPQIIHSNTVISKYCSIENGVIIGPNSSVLNGSIIKKGSCLLSHVNINQEVLVEPFCLIGAGAIIGNNTILREGCHIGMGISVKLKEIIDPWTYFDNSEK